MRTRASAQLFVLRDRHERPAEDVVLFDRRGEKSIPSAPARKLGSHILTETMERRPDIGLDSYDRFFPNQDTVPSRPEVERVVPHRSPFFTSHRLIAWMYSGVGMKLRSLFRNPAAFLSS